MKQNSGGNIVNELLVLAKLLRYNRMFGPGVSHGGEDERIEVKALVSDVDLDGI